MMSHQLSKNKRTTVDSSDESLVLGLIDQLNVHSIVLGSGSKWKIAALE